jgi:hypothetical protein
MIGVDNSDGIVPIVNPEISISLRSIAINHRVRIHLEPCFYCI